MLFIFLQVFGLASISFGLGLFSLPLGIIAFGASCLLVGISLERDSK